MKKYIKNDKMKIWGGGGKNDNILNILIVNYREKSIKMTKF